MAVALYDLKQVTCTLDGIELGGYAENEALRFEWFDDAATITHTADGRMVASRTTIDTVLLTISLMQSSDSHRELAAAVHQQHGFGLPRGARPNVILPNPFQMLDGPIGDFCNSGFATYLSRPNLDKNRTMGMVQYRLALPNARFSFGLNNLLT